MEPQLKVLDAVQYAGYKERSHIVGVRLVQFVNLVK